MDSHIYDIRANTTDRQKPYLEMDIKCNFYPPFELFSIYLTDLNHNELDLNDGRFVNFQSDLLDENNIEYKMTGYPAWWFGERLDWIGENIHNPWTFTAIVPDAQQLYFKWILSNIDDALLFKLTF